MKNGFSQESKVISFWETGWNDAKELNWNKAIHSSFLQVSLANCFWNHWNCAWLSVKQFFTSKACAELFILCGKERQGAECVWFPRNCLVETEDVHAVITWGRPWLSGAVSPPLLRGAVTIVTAVGFLGKTLFCFCYSEVKLLLSISSDQWSLLARLTCACYLWLCHCLWSEVDWFLMEPSGDCAVWRSRCYTPSKLLCGETMLFNGYNSSGLVLMEGVLGMDVCQ